jgi:hypothetical protein
MKEFVRDLGRNAGVYTASTSRFGIDAQLDLAQLTSADPLKTILDVGANFCQTAVRFTAAFPSANLICSFESVPASFNLLRASVKPLPQVRIFIALSATRQA